MPGPLSYAQRIPLFNNKSAKRLLGIMEDKKSNLVFAPNSQSVKALLGLIKQVHESICVLKIHIDLLEDLSPDTPHQLREIADRYNFLLFEGHTFADNIAIADQLYSKGLFKIADWAHIIHTHSFPGPGLITALQKVGLAKGNGLLLLAEMTEKGHLMTKSYTQKSVELAESYNDFVIGLIAQKRLTDNPSLLHFTEANRLQNGHLPKEAIFHRDNDLIIVGSPICCARDPGREARLYQQEGWQAYLERIQNGTSSEVLSKNSQAKKIH